MYTLAIVQARPELSLLFVGDDSGHHLRIFWGFWGHET